MLRLLSALRPSITGDTSVETAITENEHCTGTAVIEVKLLDQMAKFSQVIFIVRPWHQFSGMGCTSPTTAKGYFTYAAKLWPEQFTSRTPLYFFLERPTESI